MVKTTLIKRITVLLSVLLVIFVTAFIYLDLNSSKKADSNLVQKEDTKLDRVEMKKARSEYFFNILRDPKTNQIPANIRNRELAYARFLPTANQALQHAKSKNPSLRSIDYNWQQAGPFDLGGRTRALAVDLDNPNIIMAGGVSGGMWKSVDNGDSWQLKTPNLPNLSVTSVAQHPNQRDTWYYASGEILGNSASASNSAPYYGKGIYRSTDNGESWSLLPEASSTINLGLVDRFNTISRIRISPKSGTVFIASNGFGIYRSTDGETFSEDPILGTEGEQIFCDVAIASDGTIAAVISEFEFDDQANPTPDSPNHDPGVFISEDDGQSWTEITPSTFPDTHNRSVLAFAPSNPDILYTFTLKRTSSTNQGVSFHKFDLAGGTAEDRSANLPDFRESDNGSGYVELQNGYNMALAVKPDDENYVFLGGTNLFRSSNGFADSPSGGYDGSNESQKDQYWIGGYAQDNSFDLYPNQHPDQHILAFPEPQANPNRMWAGHDGGLSLTDNVTAEPVSWENKDNGYITSQFYATDIPDQADDNRFSGGTQDNGTPFFRFDTSSSSSSNSIDISSGDGGYTFWGSNYLFASSQLGTVLRITIDSDGDVTSPFDGTTSTQWAEVQPADAANQLFIHPYAVDANDENIMYYPSGSTIWRNTQINQIPNFNQEGADAGWEQLTSATVGNQHLITALSVSKNPANILYFAGSSQNQRPQMRRLSNANTANSELTNIPLPTDNDITGAYVKDIAINPINANEVIVVLSNYNIVGVYHTTDGGENWTAIEGNLTGNEQSPGPSLRSAAIIPAESGTIYHLGTSTGLYSTQLLEGDQTTWGQQAPDQIGNAVTEHLASRFSDGDIAAGTHGRGIFLGDFQGSVDAPVVTANPTEGRAGNSITLTATNFEFRSNPQDNEVTFNNVSASVLSASANQLEVEIPRAAVDPKAQNNTVILTVDTGTESVSTSFTILPPNDFVVKQNYPNPFSQTTSIPFDLPVDSEITITVYDITGKKILQPLIQESYQAGSYDEGIDFSSLASGTYIYVVFAEASSGNDTALLTKKMTHIK